MFLFFYQIFFKFRECIGGKEHRSALSHQAAGPSLFRTIHFRKLKLFLFYRNAVAKHKCNPYKFLLKKFNFLRSHMKGNKAKIKSNQTKQDPHKIDRIVRAEFCQSNNAIHEYKTGKNKRPYSFICHAFVFRFIYFIFFHSITSF